MHFVHRRTGIVAVVLAVIAGCGQVPQKGMSLDWTPRQALGAFSLGDIKTTAIEFAPFTDEREKPQVIGENREKSVTRTATTRDDVGKFMRENMRESFNDAGLRTVDKDGDAIVSASVRQFFVTETTTYRGEVSLQVTLRDRAGTSLWQGTTTGMAEHFGHSFTTDNYNETLSDATLDATAALLRTPEFHQALAQVPVSAPPPTPRKK